MKQFIKVITSSPKRLFKSSSKKDRSIVSRSDPSSNSYGEMSISSSDSNKGSDSRADAADIGTPTSVLPQENSGDWSYISTTADLFHAFKVMDGDNDGIVSRTQLEALLLRIGDEDEVATMLSEVDREGDGCISLEALMSKLGSACEPAGDDELKVAFEFFDSDNDGKITAEELLGVYKAIGDDMCSLEDCRRMIAVVDNNGDGIVCFEDFCRMMVHQR